MTFPTHSDTDPSRRRFLLGLAASGGSLAPALLAGSVRRAEPRPGATDSPPAAAEGVVLRASRFTAAPDGRWREVMGYNGQVPGPTIRVREGETLRVKVVNQLGKVPTSTHWHGMHQPGTFQMDGVPDVSRPPIAPGAEFTYEFKATPAGTHWYHAHVGVQYSNGLFGPLIVEEREPIAAYDREEVLIVSDWFLQPSEALLASVLKGAFMKMPAETGKKDMKGMRGMKEKRDVGDVPFQSALINGKGRAPGDAKSPLTVVEVKKGEAVRLRLINGSSTYAFRFQIDGHPLTVIAADGAPVQPVVVDNLVLAVGERFDVLLKAEQDGARWIRVATPDGNEGRAVLRYRGSAGGDPGAGPVRWGERLLGPGQIRSPRPVLLPEKPKEIALALGGSMTPYRWGINGQFYPKADPIELAKGDWVRMVFRNPTGMDHPFHLHGHSFYVLGKPGALNLKDPALKDTVNVPARGELAIQWQAKNPGRWFFHCHIEWHAEAGMARMIEIKPY
jgi:FtsP/CotA-like multicopper oxidase with cupredoxin domain